MTLNVPVRRRSWFLRIYPVLLAACLFVFVLGANWVTLDRFGSDLPDWDQWDAEATELLRPWFEHDHFIAHLFTPQNEHRIILTKLQNLAVVLVTGQWDSRVESFFNAFLHAGIALALWEMGRRWLARWLQPAYYVLIGALYGLPLAWQNLLGGFHSQQYWLILTAVGAVALLPFAEFRSAAWWIGIASAVLALAAMASGLVAAAVVVALVAWRWIEDRVNAGSAPTNGRQSATGRANDRAPGSVTPQALVTLVILAVLIAVGAATQVHVDYHDVLKARSAHDFFLNLLRSLAWPLRDRDWTAAVLWAPWTLLLVATVRRLLTRGGRSSRAELTVIGLGGWVLLQLVATAYARGAGAGYPASRYMDTLFISIAANALALGWMVRGVAARRSGASFPASIEAIAPRAATSHGTGSASARGNGNPGDRWSLDESTTDAPQRTTTPAARHAGINRFLVGALATAWAAGVTLGLAALWDRNVHHELVDTRNYYRGCETNVRSYLTSHHPADLDDPKHIPYPSAEGLMERLSHPAIEALMTSSVRPALPIQPDRISPATAFIENNPAHAHPGARAAKGAAPDTPELTGWTTWGSYTNGGRANTGEWRSESIPPPHTAWLRMETSGDIDQPGLSLQLRDAKTDAVLANVRPSHRPGPSWRTAYVRAPRRPFVIVADDHDRNGWFAFSAPVEMPELSHLAWWLMKSGAFIAKLAGGAAAVVALGAWYFRRRLTGEP